MNRKIGIFFICILFCIAAILAGSSLYTYGHKQLSGIKVDPIMFGATYMTLNNPFFEVIDQEMRNAIEANGDLLISMDPQLSVDRQIDQIHYLIQQGCQVLIVNPVNSKGLEDVLKEAKQNGIYIIAIDTNVYNGNDFVDYTVVSDNYKAGVLCAQDMMKQKEQAAVLVLKHEAAYSAVERIQGFMDTIQGNENYQIVDVVECEGQLEKSMPLVAQRLKDGLKFDVVMSLNDPSAMGAIAALQEAGVLQGVLVYGVDGTPEAKVLIKDGFMMGSVAQYPKSMAKKAVECSYRLLDNETNMIEEKVDVSMIDQYNINLYSLEGWQ